MLRLTLLTICTLVIFGCSTTMIKAMEDVKPGMDRDSVIELIGGPNRKFRENSQDHWIYIYYQNDVQWLRDVIFENGKVVRLTEPTAKAAWEKELEATNTMEEYEAKVKAHQEKALKKNEP